VVGRIEKPPQSVLPAVIQAKIKQAFDAGYNKRTADEGRAAAARGRGPSHRSAALMPMPQRFQLSELRATACNSASCCARFALFATGGRAALEHQGSRRQSCCWGRSDRRRGMGTNAGTRYREYLQSPWWQRRRQLRLAVAGYVCEFASWNGQYDRYCDATENLEVHHTHYGSLGAERDEDLKVLCRVHHLVRHVLHIRCLCGDSVVTEDEAEDLVREAVESADGDIRQVTLAISR